MKYVVNLTGNRNSMDGSILGKVEDFKVEMNQHEKEELNNYKKHPHMSACDRKSIVHNRFNNRYNPQNETFRHYRTSRLFS